MKVRDREGNTVANVLSDAEAVRWYQASGMAGDYLDDTGELLSELEHRLEMRDER